MKIAFSRSLPHCVAMISLAALGCGCSAVPASVSQSTESDLVVVQIPLVNAPDRGRELSDLDLRYRLGSRIVLVNSGRSAEIRRILSVGFAAAGAPVASPDGDSVLFAGRRTRDSRWGVYEVSTSGSRPRTVVELDRDCGDPAYLAGDRVVVACADEPTIAPSRSDAGGSLYTTTRFGAEFERITFGVGSARGPSPLRDGRILFSMQRDARGDRSFRNGTALFTVNPDGSMIEPFHGSHGEPANRYRARETADGGVVFVSRSPRSSPVLQRVEMRFPTETAKTLSYALGTAPDRVRFDPISVEPIADGALLLTGTVESKTGVAATSAVYRAGFDSGALVTLFDDPEWDEVEAVYLAPVAPRRGKPTGLRSDLQNGKLIVYDVNRSDGVVGPTLGHARPTGLALQVLSNGKPETLGIVPIWDDGSVFVEVPSDRPIRVRSLEPDGDVLSTSDWFWVRAGETRACFGCHESRAAAPVNRAILALAQPPVALLDLDAEGAAR